MIESIAPFCELIRSLCFRLFIFAEIKKNTHSTIEYKNLS
jgi:hypothetical protein